MLPKVLLEPRNDIGANPVSQTGAVSLRHFLSWLLLAGSGTPASREE